MVSASRFLKYCRFPFLWTFWFYHDLIVLFLPSFAVFRFSLFHGTFFSAKFHPYILTVFSWLSNSFSFLANKLILFMYIRCLISFFFFFFCDLWSSYLPFDFLSKWFYVIFAIRNNNGASAFPWKILRIFALDKPFLPAVSSTLQFYMIFLDIRHRQR